jgi:glycosyltransferase involved in cell wall biosynthesis
VSRAPGTPAAVLHLVAPADFGGLESVMLTLCRGQLDGGHRVTVASFIDPGRADHPFVAALEAAAIPSRTIYVPTRGYLAERRAVREMVMELRPDVVHTHGYRPDVVDSGVARRMGVATCTTVHGFASTGPRGKLYEWLQRLWFRRFDAVVAVSEKLRSDLVAGGLAPDRVHLLRNAWQPARPGLSRDEARSALGLDPEARVAGWVGRLSAEKGPEVAIEALAACGDPNVTLSVIGSGPQEERLRALAARRNVASRVRWHGVVPDAGSHLAAFDALLLTSWTEGTPIVLLEAMAAEVPVVTTAVGGVPDVVSDREAVLVDAGDAAAVGRALNAVFADPDGARRRAHAARARLTEDFAVAPWVARYAEVYAACVKARSVADSEAPRHY